VVPEIVGPLIEGQNHLLGICEPGALILIAIVPAGGGTPDSFTTQCTENGTLADPPGLGLARPLHGGEILQIRDTTNDLPGPDRVVESTSTLRTSGAWLVFLALGLLALLVLRPKARLRTTVARLFGGSTLAPAWLPLDALFEPVAKVVLSQESAPGQPQVPSP
jgi:hypothetical protein